MKLSELKINQIVHVIGGVDVKIIEIINEEKVKATWIYKGIPKIGTFEAKWFSPILDQSDSNPITIPEEYI